MFSTEEMKSRAEQFKQQAAQLNADAEMIEKLLASGIDVAYINRLMGVMGEAAAVSLLGVNKPAKKAGRPAKTASKAAKPAKPKADAKPRGTRTQPSLKSLILDVLSKNKAGLELSEIVEEVLKTGYTSSAKNFSIVVYQNLYQLSQKDTVGHNKDDHKYSIIKAA